MLWRRLSGAGGVGGAFSVTLTTNQTNLDLRSYAVSAGWDEASALEFIIDNGVIVSGDTQNNSTAALTVSGTFPGGVTVVNNGFIVGRGGDGGRGGDNVNPFGGDGTTGGRAVLVSSAATFDNLGTIAGGGGGGGGGGDSRGVNQIGGGGGGGQSGLIDSLGGPATSPASPGEDGTFSAAGLGGLPAGAGGEGGDGGDWGSAGQPGVDGNDGIGGFPGFAGQAISGNSNITWITTGTRLGPIV